MTEYIMSVLYPPIQEEMRIRGNIALGPSGLGQYFPVFSSPLGLGGTIRIHYLSIHLLDLYRTALPGHKKMGDGDGDGERGQAGFC